MTACTLCSYISSQRLAISKLLPNSADSDGAAADDTAAADGDTAAAADGQAALHAVEMPAALQKAKQQFEAWQETFSDAEPTVESALQLLLARCELLLACRQHAGVPSRNLIRVLLWQALFHM